MKRRPTATSAFGVSRRESHDASSFYRRFQAPVVSADAAVAAHRAIDKLLVGDARRMDEVPDASVALVVTSPPYFAGKEYEQTLGRDGIPGTYLEYLDLLRDVFAECVRTLEPGGRIAVNVANLGRRPYRSLSADVISILQDDLGLLLRGEIIWLKQKGASGSCAWGSFARPANPVLRDVTERIVVASKGRFDRALPPSERTRRELPDRATIRRDDFLEATLDVWDVPAESARRIGHPAPFPVELVARLIELYTYAGDLVLDPFAGSGSSAVAAVLSGRHYAGYDLDEGYIRLAESRVAAARPSAPPTPAVAPLELLLSAGLADASRHPRPVAGVVADWSATAAGGSPWLFLVAGPDSRWRRGLARSDELLKAVARASAIHHGGGPPVVLLSPALPDRASPGSRLLDAVTGPDRPLRAVLSLSDPASPTALRDLVNRPI